MATTIALINGAPPASVGVVPWGPPQPAGNVTNVTMIGQSSMVGEGDRDSSPTLVTAEATG